jgi:hypothetical protein
VQVAAFVHENRLVLLHRPASRPAPEPKALPSQRPRSRWPPEIMASSALRVFIG